MDPQNDFRSLRTIFLDRDGVINEKLPENCYVGHWDDFHILPGVPNAIARLNRAGLLVLVVSNQRGIALGKYSSEAVIGIHNKLQGELAAFDAWIDGFYFCPHDRDQCDCRKPLSGLFIQAKSEFPQIEWARSLLIGDSLSDIQAGIRLAMRTVLLDSGEHQSPSYPEAACLAGSIFPSLSAAVNAILHSREPDSHT